MVWRALHSMSSKISLVYHAFSLLPLELGNERYEHIWRN